MKTVTFYSYKGGVGRTLLLANIAKYLVRFGQKVFAMDFDLEAPGLHYKLNLLNPTGSGNLRLGLVDYIHQFAVGEVIPDAFQDYVIKLDTPESTRGTLHLMPAGNVLASSYWRRLAQISWNNLFYEKTSKGVAFFIDLKARIEQDFEPDFLLIDSRTGITEVAGVATTIMPDDVVCLLLHNNENMEGAREVLRSIKRTRRNRNQDPINIVPVVARFPVVDSNYERIIIEQIKSFLNEDAPELADTLSVRDLHVLHIERALEVEETILIDVDADKAIDESPLLRDYIRLFSHIFPEQKFKPEIETLVRHAMENTSNDTAQVERTLLSLTQFSMHPRALQALLEFYKKQPDNRGEKILWASARYWQLTNNPHEPLLHAAVEEHFKWPAVRKIFREGYSEHYVPIDFINAVWLSRGKNDIKLGLSLAQAFMSLDQPLQAAGTIEDLIKIEGISGNEVVDSLQILTTVGMWDPGLRIAEQFRDELSDNERFQLAWATLLVKYGDRARVERALKLKAFNVELIHQSDPILYAGLFHTLGRTEVVNQVLTDYIRSAPIKELYYRTWRSQKKVVEIGKAYKKYGLYEEFENKVRQDLQPRDARRVLQEIEPHGI